MPALSSDLLHALRNLASKEAGREVDWISISAARELTDMGLAERNAAGWNISAEGSATLLALDMSRRPRPPQRATAKISRLPE